jgi:NAD(P)H-hydrate epimerase
MPGAAALVTAAAARAGAGLVTLGYLDVAVRAAVAAHCAEATFLDLTQTREAGDLRELLSARADHAIVLGPGLGRGEAAASLVADTLAAGLLPTVLDADGLNLVSDVPERLAEHEAPLVLTPHAGEAQRLLGRPVPRDPGGRVECALELARRAGAICCLKGPGTVVTDGTVVHINETGNAGLATAGSGDVLAGILVAYLAAATLRGGESFGPLQAARAAVHVHGLAGDMAAAQVGQRALIASDLIAHLPEAQRALEEDTGE